MEKIRIAIIGVGNCSSSLIQGINYYKKKESKEAIGLMHWEIGGYKPFDIEVVAAFDIDKRKVGKDVSEAIFAKPNCTKVFCNEIAKTNVKVKMGKLLDGVASHMRNQDEDRTFIPANEKEADKESIVNRLKESNTEILLNYLPVGSEAAVKFYEEIPIFLTC